MVKKELEHSFHTSGCIFYQYPVDDLYGLLFDEDGSIIDEVQTSACSQEWGKPYHIFRDNEDDRLTIPSQLLLSWKSIEENLCYFISTVIPKQKIEEMSQYRDIEHIIIGIAPLGNVVIWVNNYFKSELVLSDKAVAKKIRENLEVNGLPARDLFDRYMQQFCYRYLVMFERWDEDEERWVKPELDEEEQVVDGKPMPEFDFIEEALWDGTHDKLHDGGLMSYHMAGKPKKLAIEWYIKKSQYSAYLWFEDELIRAAFEKFYGAHRDTKVDFIIRIDPEKNKYELALYRYGLQEPVVISENAYQMIVFKSKFEYYRSENYDQPRGAWIW